MIRVVIECFPSESNSLACLASPFNVSCDIEFSRLYCEVEELMAQVTNEKAHLVTGWWRFHRSYLWICG